MKLDINSVMSEPYEDNMFENEASSINNEEIKPIDRPKFI